VVLVGGTAVVWGTEVLVAGTVVRGTFVVLVVAGAAVVVVLGGGVVVLGDVVVLAGVVVEVVDEGGVGSAVAAPLPLVTATAPRKPPTTSAMVSPEAKGRSLGPTRRTDNGLPPRALDRVSTRHGRAATWRVQGFDEVVKGPCAGPVRACRRCHVPHCGGTGGGCAGGRPVDAGAQE
jgi:hypothetical protein